jgi:hypothetical protein
MSIPKKLVKDVQDFFASEESVAMEVKNMNSKLSLFQGKKDFDAIVYRKVGKNTTPRDKSPKDGRLAIFNDYKNIPKAEYDSLVKSKKISKDVRVKVSLTSDGKNAQEVTVKKINPETNKRIDEEMKNFIAEKQIFTNERYNFIKDFLDANIQKHVKNVKNEENTKETKKQYVPPKSGGGKRRRKTRKRL